MPDAGIEERLKALAAKRKLSDLSVGPVLTWTNERMKAHIDRLLQIPGAPRCASVTQRNNMILYDLYFGNTCIFISNAPEIGRSCKRRMVLKRSTGLHGRGKPRETAQELGCECRKAVREWGCLAERLVCHPAQPTNM